MNSEMYNHFIEQIGEQPLETIRYIPEDAEPLFVSFVPTGTGQAGSLQTCIVPVGGVYHMKARGAAGQLGSYQRSASLEFPSDPGHAAIVETDVQLAAGDELLILVGQRGENIRAVATDGCSGAGGGGTFIFRKLASITDSRYQITINGSAYECLLVAAGGGGTQDNAYRQSTAPGYDAAEQLYSLSNFKAFSTTTGSPTSSGGTSSPMGLSQIANATYAGQGKYYMRNNNKGYGGYGCGGMQDDNYSYGGGWSSSSITYRTASWAKEGGTLSIATDFSEGLFELTGPPEYHYHAWWQPVFNRTEADCVYGNINGSVDSRLLCRLEGNIDFLFYMFHEFHELSIDISMEPETLWQRQLYVFYLQLYEIRNEIMTIWRTVYHVTGRPSPKILNYGRPVKFERINEWEQLLFDARELLRGVQDNRLVLGTFSVGQSRLRQSIRR